MNGLIGTSQRLIGGSLIGVTVEFVEPPEPPPTVPDNALHTHDGQPIMTHDGKHLVAHG